MDITKIINEKLIDLNLKAKTKDEAIWELAELLEKTELYLQKKNL